jgi:hypothetical protein
LGLLLIILQTPPPPGGGDTGIDELPIDHWIYFGIFIGIIIILFKSKALIKKL